MDKKCLRRVPKLTDPKEHYGGLDIFPEEELQKASGLFSFPEELHGKTNWGERKFVVFYFDEESHYDEVVNKLSRPSNVKQHPMMDSDKLLRLLKDA